MKQIQIQRALEKFPGFEIIVTFKSEKGYAVLTRAAYHHQLFFLNNDFQHTGEIVFGGYYFPDNSKENCLITKMIFFIELFGKYERIE